MGCRLCFGIIMLGALLAAQDEPGVPQYPVAHAECIRFGPQYQRYIPNAHRAAVTAMTNLVTSQLSPSASRLTAKLQPAAQAGGNDIDAYIFAALRSAAVRAGQYGLKTAIIEKDYKLGGTCLHVGCIPTKALLHTADVWEYFQNSAEQGIQCENPKLDYPKVLDRKNKIVAKHAKGVEFLMKKNKVETVKGW